jgi:quinone-modifying oxidoreductase subunit QmoC
MEFVEVGSVNDLDEGQMVGFEVDDRRILLAKVEGEFFAIGGTCTHERSNLDQGALLGHVVYCPLHYSAFDVRSGAVLGPPAECPVPKHEVRVEDGRVLVCTQPCGLESAAAAPAGNGAAAAQDVATESAPVTQDPVSEPAPAAHAAVTEPAVVTQDAAPEPASVAHAATADLADATQAAPEPAGVTRELMDQLARLEQTVKESSGELAERIGRLEQTVRDLRRELEAAKTPAQPGSGSGGGDPWEHQSPRFMSRIPTSARYLPLAVAIPAAIVVVLVLTAAVVFRDGPAVPDGDILFEHFIGHGWLDIFVLTVVGVVAAVAATGIRRHWKGLQGTVPSALPRQPLGGAVRGTAEEVLKHDGFETWTVSDVQRRAHLKIFYGFLGLLAATTGAAIYTEIFPILGIDWHDNELSLPIWDPVKIVGNVGGIALLVGLTQVISTWRRRSSDRAGYSDWFFPALLGLTVLSGFSTEILRYAGVRLAYPAYAVHLVFVFGLFVYFPFSKFAHALYYPTGFTFARSIGGRKKAAPSPVRAPVSSSTIEGTTT